MNMVKYKTFERTKVIKSVDSALNLLKKVVDFQLES